MQIVVSKEKSKYGEAVFIRVTLEKMDNDLDVRFANRMCGEVGFFVDEENLARLVSELQRHLTKRAVDEAHCDDCAHRWHAEDDSSFICIDCGAKMQRLNKLERGNHGQRNLGSYRCFLETA